jgi:hypothetical protein
MGESAREKINTAAARTFTTGITLGVDHPRFFLQKIDYNMGF